MGKKDKQDSSNNNNSDLAKLLEREIPEEVKQKVLKDISKGEEASNDCSGR